TPSTKDRVIKMDRYEHLNDTRVVAIEVTPMWSGDLPISVVNEALKAVGLDEKLFPPTPSRAKAMRRAFEALAPRGSRIDSLPKGMGVSMSIKNSSKLDLQELQERTGIRSEEHTSELQSRENLVCRLLLEKKKTREL